MRFPYKWSPNKWEFTLLYVYDFVRYGLLNYIVPHFSWLYFVGYIITKLFLIIISFHIYLNPFNILLMTFINWIVVGYGYSQVLSEIKFVKCGFVKFLSLDCFVSFVIKKNQGKYIFQSGNQGKVREFDTGFWLATLNWQMLIYYTKIIYLRGSL